MEVYAKLSFRLYSIKGSDTIFYIQWQNMNKVGDLVKCIWQPKIKLEVVIYGNKRMKDLDVIIVNLYFCQTSIYGIHHFKQFSQDNFVLACGILETYTKIYKHL